MMNLFDFLETGEYTFFFGVHISDLQTFIHFGHKF